MKAFVFLLIYICSSRVFSSIKTELRLAISSAPNNLIPFYSTDANSQNIGRLVHLSLIDLDEQMKFVCMACSSYKEIFKNGKHILRFVLKRDLKFHDGTPIMAMDVKNTVKYFQDSTSVKSPFRFAFEKIKEVKILGDYEVEFYYDHFDLENISNLPLLKIVKLMGDPRSLTSVIGAGSYKIGRLDALSILLLPIKSGAHRLNFVVVKDETTLALKMMNREVDVILSSITPRKFEWMAKNLEINIGQNNGTGVYYIGINHKRPILSSEKVRQALSLLIPRDDIIRYKLKGMAQKSDGLLSNAFKDYYVKVKQLDYNFDLAQKLLDEAGYPKNKEGIRFKLNWRLVNKQNALELVNTIQSYYEKAGIKIQLITQEWGAYYRGLRNGEYDLVLANWIGFTGPEMLYSIFNSKNFTPQGLNRGFFEDRQIDTMLNEVKKEVNKDERIKKYKNIQLALRDKYPYLYLWHPKVTWIGRKCIDNLNVYPNGSFLPILKINHKCE